MDSYSFLVSKNIMLVNTVDQATRLEKFYSLISTLCFTSSCKKRPLSTSAEVDGRVHAKLWRVGSSPSEASDTQETDVSAGEEGLDVGNSDSDHALHKQLRKTLLTLPSSQTRLSATSSQATTPSHAAPPQPPGSSFSECSETAGAVGPAMQSAVTVEVKNLIIHANLTPSTPKPPQLKRILPRPSPPTPKPSSGSFVVPKSFTRGKKTKAKGKGVNSGRCGLKAGSAPVTPTSNAPTVAMQPELDDVDGLLFVSFTSRVKSFHSSIHPF